MLFDFCLLLRMSYSVHSFESCSVLCSMLWRYWRML